MQICSLGFIFDTSLTQVLLVHKNRPAWQAGKVNGVGGKVEAGETPLQCMARECEEETSLAIPGDDWRHFGAMHEDGATIELFTAVYTGSTTDAAQNDHEAIEWVPYQPLPETVVPNLHFLVPLAREMLRGHDAKSITIHY